MCSWTAALIAIAIPLHLVGLVRGLLGRLVGPVAQLVGLLLRPVAGLLRPFTDLVTSLGRRFRGGIAGFFKFVFAAHSALLTERSRGGRPRPGPTRDA